MTTISNKHLAYLLQDQAWTWNEIQQAIAGSGRSEATKRIYRVRLDIFERWRFQEGEGRTPTKKMVRDYITWLEQGYVRKSSVKGKPIRVRVTKASTKKAHINALRFWFRALIDLAEDHDWSRAEKYDFIEGIRRIVDHRWEYEDPATTIPYRVLTLDEIDKLLATCDAGKPTPAAALRDKAIMEIMWATACRVGSISNLKMEDIQEIEVKGKSAIKLLFTMKGGKIHSNAIGNSAKKALEEWLAIRGDMPGFVFLAISTGGNILYKEKWCWYQEALKDPKYSSIAIPPDEERFGTHGIRTAIQKRFVLAGVDLPAQYNTCHIFRHSRLTYLDRLGISLSELQDFVGHVSVETTRHYIEADEERKFEIGFEL